MKTEKKLVVVPGQHYEEVLQRLNAIRERDEPRRLEYDCEMLKEEVSREFGHEADVTELKDGHRYGQLIYSMSANAVRNGRVVQNHGEIYLTIWVYSAKGGLFYQENAWGNISTKELPGCPMIELN